MGAVGWMTIIPYRIRSQRPKARRNLGPASGGTVGWLTMQSGSEKELQSQLNESGVARRLRKSPCTIGIAIVHRAATYAGIKICAVVGRRTVEEKLARHKLGIVMVPHIEKLCAELEAISLADRKGLEYREVPVLETRPADDVPA